jgi:hypothetical protein
MPAGRPTTTGPSRHVTFRARGPVGDRLEQRRTLPDLSGLPVYGGPKPDPQGPKLGAVAARDLAVYYQLADAELADAARQLTPGQVHMMLSAVWSLATDHTWALNAPVLLASEIEDDYPDDETGPDTERKALAATVRAWPRLRALAVLEALLTARATHEGDTLAALTRVGLITPAQD